MRGLQLYGMPGRRAEFDQRIGRARAWLLAAKVKTTDDLAMRLLGLKWAGADPAVVQLAARQLMQAQRTDGGWGQNPDLASDAYGT